MSPLPQPGEPWSYSCVREWCLDAKLWVLSVFIALRRSRSEALCVCTQAHIHIYVHLSPPTVTHSGLIPRLLHPQSSRLRSRKPQVPVIVNGYTFVPSLAGNRCHQVWPPPAPWVEALSPAQALTPAPRFTATPDTTSILTSLRPGLKGLPPALPWTSDTVLGGLPKWMTFSHPSWSTCHMGATFYQK